MTPLNLYLESATPEEVDDVVREYGDAIRELAIANVFAGDMLWRNFGVNRHGRVVFYDYDEIEYLTDCTFRVIPPPPNPEAELSGEPWYPVGRARRLPRGVRDLPARQPAGARGLHAPPRRPARSPSSGSAASSRWGGARSSTSSPTPRRALQPAVRLQLRRPPAGQFFTIQEPDRHRDPG